MAKPAWMGNTGCVTGSGSHGGRATSHDGDENVGEAAARDPYEARPQYTHNRPINRDGTADRRTQAERHAKEHPALPAADQ